MNGLSLCAGIGGLDLGLRLAVKGYRTVCFVEIEAFPQDVLLARMADGVIERAPIWGDLKRFDARPWRGLVDLVHGGYPCQPFSVAGKRLGEADPRHLWPDVARVVRECEPEWCFFENVAGHLRLGFDVVARDLVDMDYRVAAGLFTAEEVGAPHRRQRLFILAHSISARRQTSGFRRNFDAGSQPEARGRVLANASSRTALEASTGQSDYARRTATAGPSGVGHVGDTDDARLEGRRESVRERADELSAWPPGPAERDRWGRVLATRPWLAPAVEDATRDWEPGSDGEYRRRERVPEAGSDRDGQEAVEPAVRRVADGAPRRVDRLKALGNGVVPDVAALAWITLERELT